MAQPAAVSLADAFVEFRERKLLEKKKLRELRAKANEKKRTQSFKSHLRRKFVEQARRYLGCLTENGFTFWTTTRSASAKDAWRQEDN